MQKKSVILIIDDDAIARQTIDALLVADGYHLEFAVDGLQGIQRAVELQPDVILLDVVMPKMNGFEVCRALRNNSRLAEVPIIMITTLDDRDSRMRGIEAGADDFVSKPYDSAELRARLRSIIRLNRYRRLSIERSRFAWIVEQSHDGYVLLDTADRVYYANPQSRFYLGISDTPGDSAPNFFDLLHQQYQLQPRDGWDAWPNINSHTPLYLVRPETQTAKPFWLKVCLFSSGDAGLGRLVSLQDVTDQITSHQDMRKFHRAIEHKFRTPMVYLQISLNLLQRYATRQQLDDFVQMITDAMNGVTRLKSQIDDVFNYIRAPTLAIHGEGFNLSQLKEVVEVLKSAFELDSVDVILPEALQSTTLALTRPAMELILWELLENAKKFHPQRKPYIQVRVAPADNNSVTVSVQDDGIHLSPVQLTWALTPYLQGEKDFTGESPGMGLGLPSVSTLLWQVGGSVHISNRPDSPGVLVDVVVPLAR